MLQYWQNVFPAEPVKRPEQENVKLVLGADSAVERTSELSYCD